MPHRALSAALTAFACTAPVSAQQEPKAPLRVHEWGTFTCLMDDDGMSLGGVNTEDEPLPKFVVRPLADAFPAGFLLTPGDLAPCFFQGAPPCHPDVTMRLETPVVYFHLPDGADPVTLDVEVEWRGGWLSEFFPPGDAHLPGMDANPIGRIDPELSGTLRWRGVRIGGESDVAPLATTEEVWLAPRRVAATDVHVGDVTERFLFYRGVGNVTAPLRVMHDGVDGRLSFRAAVHAPRVQLATGAMWQVEIDPERGCAFRELAPLRLDSGKPDEIAGRAKSDFERGEFSFTNADRLRASMHRALVEAGLYEDEARALLDTWRISYFQSPGSRLFVILPREWTDAVMPLRVSVPCEMERVMVGRIERIGPRQRAWLATIARGPASDSGWFSRFLEASARADAAAFAKIWGEIGSRPGALLKVPGLEVPPDYRAYVELGRFRHALLLEESRRRPTSALDSFVQNYGLGH